MSLILKLRDQLVTLQIREKTRVIDFVESKYYHDLDKVCITALDKLLKRNRISVKALKTYKIQGDFGPDSTSYKIAKAFIQGLKVNL